MSPSLALLPLLAPAALVGVALAARARARGPRPRRLLRAGEAAMLCALALAAACAALTALFGAATSPLLGAGGIGLSVRLDALSVTMFLLVAFVGWVVVRFSANYLDGDPRQGAFLGGLCLTLAAVLTLVLAGNLAQLAAGWIATSLALHRLLLFRPERRGAQVAARKKFLSARLGDALLLGACLLLATLFHTTDITEIGLRAAALAGDAPMALGAAAALLAVAALLKSAQFPAHGWLPEVMETPTPVSALLHAGIINAGGFLVLRLADVMVAAPGALHLLALVGGFTALFGGFVMLTQTSAKVALAWSTVSQMGFMLFECGVGAFPLAVLHIVAHALYKAHAFLSAGGAVVAARGVVPLRLGVGLPRVVAGLAAGLALAALALALPWVGETSLADRSLTVIVALGLAVPIAAGIGGRGGVLVSVMVALPAYVVLRHVMERVFAGALPPPPAPTPLALAILSLELAGFVAATLVQATAPAWQATRFGRALLVHLANGFYVNAVLDRLVGSLRGASTREIV